MDMIKKLGSLVQKNRKSKNISTPELAKKLGVSVGLINNIEHGRNDVFKLDLLMKLCKELNLSISDITSNTILEINKLNINDTDKKLEIYLNSKKISSKELVEKNILILINAFLNSLDQLGYNSEAIDIVTKHLVEELRYTDMITRDRVL